MGTYTNYLKLQKPDETEKYNIGTFNSNADIIDSALARMEQKNESQDNLLASKASLDSHMNNHENPHDVNKYQIGLGNVENKSSSAIRNELTKNNVTTALGYTPYTPNEVDNRLDTLETKITGRQHTHTNKTVLDGITSALITAWNTVSNKVDKIAGKGLSTNDYTNEEKNKLRGIESGAKANVQADWNVSDQTSDAYIKNKPNLSAYSPSVMTGATANAAGTSGYVPAPAKGNHNAYLRGDGTWQKTSTSLTATTPGVPLDHTAAKVLKDQIDAQNSNLSELAASLGNLFITRSMSKNFATIGSSGNYIVFDLPVVTGYRPICINGISLPANVGMNFFGISGYKVNVNFYGHVNNAAVACSITVLYAKNL